MEEGKSGKWIPWESVERREHQVSECTREGREGEGVCPRTREQKEACPQTRERGMAREEGSVLDCIVPG